MELIELMNVFNDTMCQSVKGMLVNDRKMIVIETKGSSDLATAFRKSTLTKAPVLLVWQKMHAHYWNECVRLPKPDVTRYLNHVKTNKQTKKQTNKKPTSFGSVSQVPQSKLLNINLVWGVTMSNCPRRGRERERERESRHISPLLSIHLRIRFLGLQNRQQDLERPRVSSWK